LSFVQIVVDFNDAVRVKAVRYVVITYVTNINYANVGALDLQAWLSQTVFVAQRPE